MGKMPVDKEGRVALMQKGMETKNQYFKDHPGEEWGAFPGENKGYWLGATNWQDIVRISQGFAPYFKVQAHQVISLTEFNDFYKSIMQMNP
jgi:hypothetical protein